MFIKIVLFNKIVRYWYAFRACVLAKTAHASNYVVKRTATVYKCEIWRLLTASVHRTHINYNRLRF